MSFSRCLEQRTHQTVALHLVVLSQPAFFSVICNVICIKDILDLKDFLFLSRQLTCHIQFENNKEFHKDFHLWGVRKHAHVSAAPPSKSCEHLLYKVKANTAGISQSPSLVLSLR